MHKFLENKVGSSLPISLLLHSVQINLTSIKTCNELQITSWRNCSLTTNYITVYKLPIALNDLDDATRVLRN